MYKSFVEKFSNEPSENAIKGYDLMHFMGTVMLKHGDAFKEWVTEDKGTGLHTAFHFQAHSSIDAQGKSSIDFTENHFVNILRFQDNTLKLVTPR